MANTIEVIIKATDQASTVIDKVEANITTGTTNAAKSIDKLTQTSAASASGFSKMQAAIVTTSQAFSLVGQVTNVAKDVIDQTVGSTMAYAKEVRELSTNLGISVEETSKIIQASDDYGISVETVTGALQMAVKRGFAPNIETLAKLADEYNNISDPVQRAARLSEVFGRGWTSLTPILSAGGKAIRDAAGEAEKLGLVLSDKDVQGARALEVSIDNLNDRVDALKLKIGKQLVPGLVTAAEDLTYLGDKVQGTVTPLDDAKRTLDRVTAAFGENSPATAHAREEYEKLLRPIEAVSQSMDEKLLRSNMKLITAFGTVQTSLSDLERGVRNQADVYAVLDSAMDKTTAKSNLLASSQALIASDMADLKTVMAGAIKNEDKQYNDSQAELQKRLKETADELKNLEGAQGSVDKSTVKNAMSAAELAKAHADLAAAQARLAAETDPVKQQQLAASIAVQQEKIAGANQAVITYVDNSKRIAELKGQYDSINKEIEANAKAHEDATKRILFGYAEQAIAQANAQAGIQGMTEAEAKALDALAVKWGLKSQADVDALQAIRDAAAGLASDNNIAAFVAKSTGELDKLAGTGPINIPVEPKVDTKAITDNPLPTVDLPVVPKVDRATLKEQKMDPVELPVKPIVEIDPKLKKDLADDLKFAPPTIKPKVDPTQAKQDFSKLFNLPEVKRIQDPLIMPVKADTASAITSMQYFNSYGLNPAITYYDALIARASLFSTIVGQTPALPALPGAPTTTTPPTTTRPPGAGPAEFAAGADFVVPPGYPGDSFPMRVSSGERVQVTPAGQGGGGNLPPINITQTFNGAQSSPEQYRAIMYEVITDVFDKAMRQ